MTPVQPQLPDLLALMKDKKQNGHYYNDQPTYTSEKMQVNEIMSSFKHALFIQQSVFGSPTNFVNRIGFDSFFMYAPKDQVSGDFYWTEQITDSTIIIIGDCTGHGMPGAFLSLFAQSACSRAVSEYRLTNPVEILKQINAVFTNTFGVNCTNGCIGMDVSVCVINKRTMVMECAGAGNPVWMVRNHELIEYPGGRCAIGQWSSLPAVTLHREQLQVNDTIYMFTDGFEDQFGYTGLRLKSGKFLKKRLRSTLLATSAFPIDKQNAHLKNVLKNWSQDCEQTDDISMLGLKIV